MKSVENKKIRNVSDDEFNALKSLQGNDKTIICQAEKGNCIVILDKTDYFKRAEQILKLKQFRRTKKSLLNENKNSWIITF